MNHNKLEKIFKIDGGRLKVIAEFSCNWSTQPTWRAQVLVCEKGKRTWVQPYDTDSYKYRQLSIEDRENHVARELQKYAHYIHSAQVELWESLKPEFMGDQEETTND